MIPIGNFFCIEQTDRSADIHVRYGLNAPTGAVVVSGVMRTDPTTRERYIAATGWSPDGPSPAIEPLLMNSRTLGGGPCGLQQGVSGGSGLNNVWACW